MDMQQHQIGTGCIVYDAGLATPPEPGWFEPEYWQERGRVIGSARGRGSSWFLHTPAGPAVLRRYLRGGWAARLSHDRYLFGGYERSRPLREFRLLAWLQEQGLPAPRPIAAYCERSGWTYRGALLTQTIEGAEPLADRLADLAADNPVWHELGACIRQFHRHGVWHADLNARNVLLGKETGIWLLDFDRGRVLQPGDARLTANLRRLRRSLEKVWPAPASAAVVECWSAVEMGYRQDEKDIE